MTSMVFHIDIVFLYDIHGFVPLISYSILHQWFFPTDILSDIDGFSHRYRIIIGHQ